jgi:hypothetical protein
LFGFNSFDPGLQATSQLLTGSRTVATPTRRTPAMKSRRVHEEM